MMKKFVYSLIAGILMFSCTNTTEPTASNVSTEPQYNIEGKIKGLNSGTALLQKVVDGKLMTIDSVAIENGVFNFNGSVEETEFYLVAFSDTLDKIHLFLENTDIAINADIEDIKDATFTGSRLTNILKIFNDAQNKYSEQSDLLYDEYKQAQEANDTELVAEIEEKYNLAEEKHQVFIKNFVKENSKNAIGVYIAYRQLVYRLELDELEEITNAFAPDLDSLKYLVNIKSQIETMRRVAVGQTYTDFTENDTKEQAVTLASHIGEKYVLLDFWASWCSPCRAENPILVENYAKYKDKGFEIFGVSLDNKKEAWLKAIEDDGITWPQVSDLKGWNCKSAKLYAVRSIPHNVLIDKDGIIVAKNLKGEELSAKLAELLD